MKKNDSREGIGARRWRFAVAISAVFLLVFVGVFTPAPARSHDLNTTYARVWVTPDSLRVIYTFNLADLAKYVGLDANGDGIATRAELAATLPKVYALVAERTSISVDFFPLDLEQRPGGFTRDPSGDFLLSEFSQDHLGEFDDVPIKTLNTEQGVILVNAVLAGDLKRLPGEIKLRVNLFEDFDNYHTTIAKIDVGEGRVFQNVFTRRKTEKRFTMGDGPSLVTQIVAFTQLGIEHIWIGYDHILFLLALIVIGGRFKQLVKIVTAFTVAHSITLVLCTLQVVSLPSRLVEAGIALSIAYVAVENFYVRRANHRWVLTFLFGLFHGFGFANVLARLGLPTRGLVSALFSFNAGVEIGQICIVAVAFPLITLAARSRHGRRVAFAVSSAILVFGIGWFIERAFNFSFMPL